MYSAQAPNLRHVVADLAAAYPQEWADCHRPERGERAWAFIRRLAWVLYSEYDNRFGLNGKRGNVRDLSMDAIAYLNLDSPAGGVEIYDVVGGAGGTNPQPAWIDQTLATVQAGTIGAWVEPTRPAGVVTPAPPSSTPPAPSQPAPCQGQPCRFEPCLAQEDINGLTEAVFKLQSQLQTIQANHDALVAWLGGHINDIKTRIDQKPVTACKSRGWL